MKKDTLMKILKERSMSFSEEELHRLIDEEIEKSPNHMDTELVDLCIEALERISDEKKSKRKRIKPKRLFLIAAVVAVAFAIAVPVGAKFVNFNASTPLVTYENDHFSVDLSKERDNIEIVTNIVSALEKEEIDNPVLPKALLNDEYIKFDIHSFNNETSFHYQSNKSNINGNVVIYNYNNNYGFLAGLAELSKEYNSVEQITINNIDIILFKYDDYVFIYYIYNNYEYNIKLFNCDFETAKAIANTIGG